MEVDVDAAGAVIVFPSCMIVALVSMLHMEAGTGLLQLVLLLAAFVSVPGAAATALDAVVTVHAGDAHLNDAVLPYDS